MYASASSYLIGTRAEAPASGCGATRARGPRAVAWHEGRVDLLDHGLPVDDDLADVAAPGQVVHRVEQHLFEDRPQATGPGAAAHRLVGEGVEGVRGELELDVLHLEELAVLLRQGVLRLDEDLHERLAVEAVHRTDHRQAADELGDQAEL